MSRLQKKCFIVSTGMHLLLVAVIFVGPAFSSSTKTPEVPYIDFTPVLFSDGQVGGGNPNVRPAMAAQPVTPPPQPVPKPLEPKPEPKPPKPEPDRSEVTKNTPEDPNDFTDQKRKPQIVTKAQVRKRPATKSNANSDSQNEDRQRDQARRAAIASEFARAAGAIKEGSATATVISDDFYGPGGGGAPYAPYDSLVQMVYRRAWVKPTDMSSDSLVVYATVTIARDGSVVQGSARIISRSGDSAMDSSIQRALDRVTTIGRPFPDAIKEKERTYKIQFDLTKQSLT